MKKILLTLILLISIICVGQNTTVDQPELRITRTTALTLSTTWQTVSFNSLTGGDNRNTYGIDPVTGKNFVWYDTATSKFMFISNYDKHFSLQLFFSATVTAISTRSRMQYRIVIPNGISQGTDAYFPYPEQGGYADLGEITIDLFQRTLSTGTINATARQALRTNGFYIQVRLTAAITLGTATLNGVLLNLKSDN